MKFSAIPGLAPIKEKLIRSVKENKVAHAQLFSGKEGALNLSLALAYTTYLHCQNRGETDSCGTCPACSKSDKHIHPDTHFVFPLSNIKSDKDAERFKAEILKSWRAFLLEQPFGKLDDWTNFYGGENKQAFISRDESREIIKTLSLKPFESPYKVMIIWQPEYMHPSASNGILKILEEPPQHTYFILVTNAAEQLLPTIISRTQSVQVPMLADEDLEAYLKTHADAGTEQRAKILQMAEGDLNFALELLEETEEEEGDQFPQWMRACYKKDYPTLVQLADEFHGYDKVTQRNFLAYGLSLMRESLLQLAHADLNRARGKDLKFIQDFSKVMDVEKIEKSHQLITNAAYHLERNGSAKMVFMNLSLQLSQIVSP